MRTSVTSILVTVLIACASGYSQAQGLVGLWQTETVRPALPGRTNIVDSYQTVEFLKDGSFKMGNTITTDGKKQTMVVFTGTYASVDTNHVRLEIASQLPGSTNKTPLTVTCSVIGDELEMSKLTSSVVPETQKYKRVKR